MLNQIKSILNKNKSIDGWLINDHIISSQELFFVGKNLDMNRSKKVHHAVVTVYKDFTIDEKKYKGSATTRISPLMEKSEIEEKLNEAALAAGFVKNPYYTLVSPTKEKLKTISSRFSTDDLSAFMPKLVNALYKNDTMKNGKINSCEFFLEKIDTYILNSLGVDETYTAYKGQIELVVDWKETDEEVEIIEIIDFSDLDEKGIESIVSDALAFAKMRAVSQPIPKIENIPVILAKENVLEFLRYYISKADANLIYQKYSNAKLSENIQGENVSGDSLTIDLVPEIKNSISSRYIDKDGVKLKKLNLYKDGKLLNYHGDNRFSQYLNLTPTGIIGNVSVKGGSQSIDEFKNEPYLELLYFSDFQMNEWTGDFGGEIRLGRYFDGEKTIPVTGGSITGNIKDVQAAMLLSKELQTKNNYICPEAIKLLNVSIAT